MPVATVSFEFDFHFVSYSISVLSTDIGLFQFSDIVETHGLLYC